MMHRTFGRSANIFFGDSQSRGTNLDSRSHLEVLPHTSFVFYRRVQSFTAFLPEQQTR